MDRGEERGRGNDSTLKRAMFNLFARIDAALEKATNLQRGNKAIRSAIVTRSNDSVPVTVDFSSYTVVLYRNRVAH
jgi:hypothetical protein